MLFPCMNLILLGCFGRSAAFKGFQSNDLFRPRSTGCSLRNRLLKRPLQPPGFGVRESSSACFMYSNNNNNNNSNGMGETAVGAILGGLLMGPFGSFWGASVGASVGAKRSLEQAKQAELKRLGITPEMVDMAQQVSMDLQRAMEGLQASEDSLRIQQSFAKRIDTEVQQLFDEAQTAVRNQNEDRARTLLFQRQSQMNKLKQVLQQCVEEKRRMERMKENVQLLEQRAMEVDSLLRRSVSAKALQDTQLRKDIYNTSMSSDIELEDPLLRKFRELEEKDF